MKQRQLGPALVLTVLALAGAVLLPASARAQRDGRQVEVIVRAHPGAVASVQALVERSGGTVGRSLPVIDGFAAEVPARALRTLRRSGRVVSVTPNARVRLYSTTSPAAYDEQNDKGSLLNVAKVVRATDLWTAGYTGEGVDVAMIDTGVAPVRGLTSGNVVLGPDLSFDSQSYELRNLDAYGHGTHMASIIAGRDEKRAPADYTRGGQFTGIAPDARLISVKVGAFDGAVDVSQVIAAIDWVVQNRTRHGFNIRVLNVAFGTDSTQDYRLDPLSYAAEVAMRHGILVVAAVGNDGKKDKTVASPALNPSVLTVGAVDAVGTYKTGDDVIPAFATKGSSTRSADVVAPAVSVIGLRAPGSFADVNHPGGRVGERFFRGSGSSQAAAVVTGVAALLAQRYPTLSAFALKEQIHYYTNTEPHLNLTMVGRGLVDARAALEGRLRKPRTPEYGTGKGSLDTSGGSSRLVADGVALTGERDIFGKRFDSSQWAAGALAGSTWTGGDWNGSTWTGSTWTSDAWFSQAWKGSTWTGMTWTGSTWTGMTWTGMTWTGSTWTGSTWTGMTWTGSTWTGTRWMNGVWSTGVYE